MRDAHGSAGNVCRSHAVRALVMIIGGTVDGLDDAARAVSASLRQRDAETVRLRTADEARERAELAGRLAPLDPERRAELAAFRAGTHSVFRAYGLSPSDAARIVREHDDDDDDD